MEEKEGLLEEKEGLFTRIYSRGFIQSKSSVNEVDAQQQRATLSPQWVQCLSSRRRSVVTAPNNWMSATPPTLTPEDHRRRRRAICADKTGTEDGGMKRGLKANKRGLKANYRTACKMAAIYV